MFRVRVKSSSSRKDFYPSTPTKISNSYNSKFRPHRNLIIDFLHFGKKCGIMIANLELCQMCMIDEIRAKRDEIYAIARAHKAEKLWVLGLCARKEEAVAI